MLQQIETLIGDRVYPAATTGEGVGYHADEFSSAVVQQAFFRLQFRIAVAISTFQIAEWQEATAKNGLHLPSRKIEDCAFPAYDMSVIERAWIARNAAERRQMNRDLIAIFLVPGIIDLIEIHSAQRPEDPFQLAWKLMTNFTEVFEPLYSALVRALLPSGAGPKAIPTLGSTMRRHREAMSDCCSAGPRLPSNMMQ